MAKMKGLLFAGLCIVLLVAAVGVSGHDDYQCPLGFEPTHCSSRKCKCMKNINDHLKCDEENQQLYLKIGYCISTYSDSDMTVVIGDCPYIHPSAKNSSIFSYFPLPPNMTASEVNGYMCGEMNRTGRLCGQCENGTGPSVFSPDLRCVRCLDSSYGWAVYLAAEFIPITVFVLLILLFRIRLCADNMNALVFFCSMSSAAMMAVSSRFVTDGKSNAERSYVVAASICNIFNLQFFQNFLPPLCMSKKMTNLEAIALRYLVALYPLLLIIVIYTLVRLYDRNFRPLVLFWKPFGLLLSRFRKTFKVQHSLIHAFASFFLLSYYNFGIASYFLLSNVNICGINNTLIAVVSYWDGTTSKFGDKISVLAVIMTTIFNLLPMVLMFVYPTRTFQKCLNCCGLRCLPLHIFMDAFQGCYKNGTEGTRDYRYFAGIYLLFRFIVFENLLHYILKSSGIVFLFLFSLSFALCCPYRRHYCNVVDCLFHAIAALSMFYFTKNDLKVFLPSSSVGLVFKVVLVLPLFYILFLVVVGWHLFPKARQFVSNRL